jgi:hypothetical protein
MSELPIRTKPHRLLDGLANCVGPLDPEFKSRLRAVIENPTSETWERAYAIMLRPSGMTLWQAVTLVDPSYPTTGPGGPRGRRNPWARVPDQLTLVRAIRYAASGRHSLVRLRALLAQPPDSP